MTHDELVEENRVLRTFRDAVVDALEVNHAYQTVHDTDGARAVADLVAIECDMALDPAISTRAAMLQRSIPPAMWCLVMPSPGYIEVPEVPTMEMIEAAFKGKVEDQDCQAQARRRDQMGADYMAMVRVAPVKPRAVEQHVFSGMPAKISPTIMRDGTPVLSLEAEGWNKALDAVVDVVRMELTPELQEVLGQPDHYCSHIAAQLRLMGHHIPFRTHEQRAAVVYWSLLLYLRHGPVWKQYAEAELKRAGEQRP